MIPPATSPVWVNIISGKKQLQSTQLAVNMMLSNIKLRYKMNQTDENVGKLVKHAHEFFTKFENVYPAEVKQLFS